MKHIYLAAPYRGTKEEIENRMKIVASVFQMIRNKGYFVSSPILHHYTFDSLSEANNGEYWLSYSRQLLTSIALNKNVVCELWILPLSGWKDSSGVKEEIETAEEYSVPIKILNIDFSLEEYK